MFKHVKPLWQFPWVYAESFIIAGGLWITGIMLGLCSGPYVLKLPGWPANIILGAGITALYILIHLFYKENRLIRWFASVPASISSITFFSILILGMGLIPQKGNNQAGLLHITGLENIRTGWPFLLSSLYLFTCLTFTILKRFRTPVKKNIFFIINHSGLWLIIFAMVLGAGDAKDLVMELNKGKTTNLGYDENNKSYELPFSLNLLSFTLNMFPPKIALFDNTTGNIVKNERGNLFLVKKNESGKISGWVIHIHDFIPLAQKDSTGVFHASSDTGSAPAAFVQVYKNNRKLNESWITCGGLKVQAEYLQIDDKYAIAMTEPEPEKFISEIAYSVDKRHYDTTTVEVNHPLKINSWKIFQMSYDKEKGRWSTLSIVEATRDKWLPVVYTGIFMLLGGAVYLFWIGKDEM